MSRTPKQTTIVWMQFIGPDHFVVLKVDHFDNDDYVSDLVEVSLENGPENAVTDSLVDFDGWATCFWRDTEGRFMVGTVDGDVAHLATEGIEAFDLSERGITQIKGRHPNQAYATAIDGTIHHWNGEGWQRVETDTPSAMFAIEPLSETSFAAAGEDGRLVVSENGQIDIVDCATNLRLTALDHINGDLFISGDKGLGYRMTPGRELTLIDGAHSSLFGFVEFQGQIFAAGTAAGILLLNDTELEPFSDVIHAYGVAKNGRYLGAFGDDDVAVFDGKLWHKIPV